MTRKYEYEQNGPKAVILFHAFTGTPNDVNSVARALERNNYTVLTPTLDGHDLEDPNELLKYGIEDWIKNGEEAYQILKQDGFTNISVFGLSLGGVIATDVMLKHNVKSYGVFSSPVLSMSETNVPKMFWRWYKNKMKNLGHNETEINTKKDEVVARVKEVLVGINDYTKKLSESYHTIELPVFIAQGGKDEMIPAEQARVFKNALPKADVNFHCYEDAPHVITVGRIGIELKKDLLKFLEQYT